MSKKYRIPILTPATEYREGLDDKVRLRKRKWLAPLAIILTVAGSGLLFESVYADRFYPGILIGGVPVGGKTFSEVLDHFQNEERVMKDTGLQINLLDNETAKKVNIPMSVTGFTPDKLLEYYSLGNWEEAVNQAYRFGRRGTFWQRTKEQAGLISGENFDLRSTSYEAGIKSLISRELENFLKKPIPAQFAIDKKGEVYILPEKIGESINQEEVIYIIKKKISSFDSSPINFQAKIEVPPTTTAKLEPFLKFARGLASQINLSFNHGGYKWKVGGSKLSTWLMIENGNEIGIDNIKLESFISKTIGATINDPAQNSRFEIRNGELVETVPGKSGSVVDIRKTAEKVEQIISNAGKSFVATENIVSALESIAPEINFNPKTGIIGIPIEITAENPKITKETIDQYRIKDLVGSSKTSFKGSSEDRKTNIKIGASKLNGLLIAPGEEFSAVNEIGYVTEEAGYVKEYVIKDNKSVKELGGGLCQIGTTLFRLALNAGLPVTERVNHRYVVGYYGPGLDATIYGPHPDLKFINDTGQYLLLQGRVEGADLILELYGQKDDRQVIISDPILRDRIPAPPIKYIPSPELPSGVEQCSETPRAGVTAEVTYRVGFPDGEIREQTFNSVYQPWQRICLFGTKK